MDPHIFLAILIHGEVDSPKRPPADLLLDEILVDAVLCGAVILAVAVLGPRIERFLCGVRLWRCHWGSGAVRTFTRLVEEAARLWCRSGEW